MSTKPQELSLLYEGKSKKLYKVGANEAIMVFKDEVTAYNGKYHDIAPGKGLYSAILSSKLFEVLEQNSIGTHYLCYMGGNRVKVRIHRVLPVEIIVRNYAYGSMLKRLPLLRELEPINPPLVEYHYKDDRLGDPLVHPRDLVIAGLVNSDELEELENLAIRTNEILKRFWEDRGLKLIDFKIEVAKTRKGLVIVDEITGDSMRLLDEKGAHLDKEIYRRTRNTKALLSAYQHLAELAGPPMRRC